MSHSFFCLILFYFNILSPQVFGHSMFLFFLEKNRRRPVTKSKMTKELHKINAPPQAKVSLTYSTQSSKKILAKMASLI